MNHRVHPLTPVLRAWSFIVASIIFAVTTFSDYTFDLVHRLLSNDRTETLQAAGIIGAGVVIAAGASLLWWRATSYTVTDIDIVFRWGLIRRKIRSARLDRTQAIDVVQPFHARLFGLAAVRIETAGGHNSRIEVRYLKRRAAENLKKQLLGQFTEGELLVPPIPIYRSLLASLFSLSAFISLVLTLTSMGFDIHLAALLPVFVSTIPNLWRTIDGSYQFTAHRVGDTINVSYGLANLQRKTLNMSRVHAISLRKTALWRPFGWWRVQVTVAGYGERSDGMTILPVGDKRTAMMLCELLTGCRVAPPIPQPSPRIPRVPHRLSPPNIRAYRRLCHRTPWLFRASCRHRVSSAHPRIWRLHWAYPANHQYFYGETSPGAGAGEHEWTRPKSRRCPALALGIAWASLTSAMTSCSGFVDRVAWGQPF